MPPAIIGGAIAAAGTIGGAVLGSKSQSKASSQAAQTQENATAAQLQLGRESLGLNRDIYNSNYALGSPFIANGLGASNAMSALLGISPGAVPANPLAGAPSAPPATGAPQTNPVASQSPLPYGGQLPQAPTGSLSLAQRAALMGGEPMGITPGPGSPVNDSRSAWLSAANGARAGTALPAGTQAPAAAAPAPATGGAPATSPLSAQNAFENFANSAGMQFQLDQGADMLNNRYAAAGALQSGAAMKAMSDYGQQTALNNYFMPYMGLLGGQQAMGAGMASSVMGVGSSFGNTAAGINNSMGNAIGSGAANIGNLQLANGQNSANMWNQVGSGLGGFASSFFPAR